jgi:hypothetical protein
MPKFKIVVAPPQIALCRSRVVIPSHVGKPDLGLHANVRCNVASMNRLDYQLLQAHATKQWLLCLVAVFKYSFPLQFESSPHFSDTCHG